MFRRLEHGTYSARVHISFIWIRLTLDLCVCDVCVHHRPGLKYHRSIPRSTINIEIVKYVSKWKLAQPTRNEKQATSNEMLFGLGNSMPAKKKPTPTCTLSFGSRRLHLRRLILRQRHILCSMRHHQAVANSWRNSRNFLEPKIYGGNFITWAFLCAYAGYTLCGCCSTAAATIGAVGAVAATASAVST